MKDVNCVVTWWHFGIVTFCHGEVRTMVTCWHGDMFFALRESILQLSISRIPTFFGELPFFAMAQIIEMRNWKTGQVVGHWHPTVDQEYGEGLKSDYWPAKATVEDGEAYIEVAPYHQHPQGYWWLRLPGGGVGRKVLWHRQLWQDAHGRELQAHEEIHHRDGDKGNNCLGNLQKTGARVHRQHHGRERRMLPRWGRRVRGPRRGVRRG